MPERDDQSYLSKPLIPGTQFIIEDNQVRIFSTNTTYVHERLRPSVEKGNVLALYKRVLSLAKEKKVSISYSMHIRRTIKENWEEYVTACASMKAQFAQIVSQSHVVKERGLHYGASDDTELKKLQRLCWDYQKIYQSGSVVSLVTAIPAKLESLVEDLSKPYRWDRIIL